MVREKVYERLTLRIPPQHYEVLQRLCEQVPGMTVPALLRQMVAEQIPDIESALDSLEMIKTGRADQGLDLMSALLAVYQAKARRMIAEIEALRPADGEGAPAGAERRLASVIQRTFVEDQGDDQ